LGREARTDVAAAAAAAVTSARRAGEKSAVAAAPPFADTRRRKSSTAQRTAAQRAKAHCGKMSLRTSTQGVHCRNRNEQNVCAAPDGADTGTGALYSDAARMRPELLQRMRDEHEATRSSSSAPLAAKRIAPPPAGRPRPVFAAGSIVDSVLGPPVPSMPKEQPHFIDDDEAEFTNAPMDMDMGEGGAPAFDVYYADDKEFPRDGFHSKYPIIVAAFDSHLTKEAREADLKRRKANRKGKGPSFEKEDAVRRLIDYEKRTRTNPSEIFTKHSFDLFEPHVVEKGELSKHKMTKLMQMLVEHECEKIKIGNEDRGKAQPEPQLNDIMGWGMVNESSQAADYAMKIFGTQNGTDRMLYDTLRLTTTNNEGKEANVAPQLPSQRGLLPLLQPPAPDTKNAVVNTLSEMLSYDAANRKAFTSMILLPTRLETEETRMKMNAIVDVRNEQSDTRVVKMIDVEQEHLNAMFACRVLPVHVKDDGSLEYGHCIWIARHPFTIVEKSAGYEGESDNLSYTIEPVSVKGGKSCVQYTDHYVQAGSEERGYVLFNALAAAVSYMPNLTDKEGTKAPALNQLMGLPKNQVPFAKGDDVHISLSTLWTAQTLAAALAQKRGIMGNGKLIKAVIQSEEALAKLDKAPGPKSFLSKGLSKLSKGVGFSR
jgi:hypothetical protein